MRAIAWFVFGMALVGAATSANRAADATADVLFTRWMEQTRTLEGRFEQVLLSSALGAGPSEKGRVYLERPGRVRWEYEDPEPKTAMVMDGRTLVYLPADHQLLRGKLEPGSILPRLLAGGTALREAFELAVVEGETRSDRARIALSPRGPSEEVVEAVVTVRTGTGELLEADITDAAGNRMRYRFTGWRRNRALPEGVFSFEPPPGTEIVEVD